MRKSWAVLLTLGLVALLCLNCVPNSEAAGGWSSSISPSFAFNGDNVTLTVTGVPGNFAFIKIMLVNETLDTQLVYLDDMGHGSVVWKVPMLAETGTYRFIVVSNGVNVTSASVSIVFDDVTYLRWRVDNVEDDNEQLREIVKRTVIELNDIQGRIFWMWAAASVTCGFAVCFGLITFLYYTDEMKAKAQRWKRLDGVKGKASRAYFTYIDPALDGWMVHTIPTLATEADRVKKRNGKPKVEPTVIVPDSNDPRGYRTHPVDVLEEPVELELPGPKELPDDELKVKKGGKMKNIIRKLRNFRVRSPKKETPIVVEDISVMETRLAEMEEAERRSRTPERSEQPPSPSPAVGTTPEKPQDAVPDVIEEEVPTEAVEAPKPRKRASPKAKTTKPRAKKAESVKEATE